MGKVSKGQFANGLLWKTFNLIFSRGLTFIISIILARVIEPEHYGLMTIWSTVLGFFNVIVIGGVDTVLVQQKDTQEDDWGTAQILCLVRALLLFVIMFISAPFLAEYYESKLLKSLLRASGIDLFCQVFITIGTAHATRRMAFKQLVLADLTATLLGGFGSISLLFIGAHNWVLLANTLLHRLTYAVILAVLAKGAFSYSFSRERVSVLMHGGHKAMANGLFDLISCSITGLFVGKKWTATEVGYHDRANKLTQMAGVETYNIVSNLLLPTFSSYQQDKDKLKAIGRKITSLTCYIMFPLMTGLAFCSREVIVLLYTEKWEFTATLMPIVCIFYAMNPLRQLCIQMNYSVGNYKQNMKTECTRMILTILGLIVLGLMQEPDIWCMAATTSLVAIINAACHMFSMREAIEYSVGEQIRDILPTIFITAVSMIPVALLKYAGLSNLIYLLAAVSAAVIVYISLSAILKLDVFCYAIVSIRSVISAKHFTEK